MKIRLARHLATAVVVICLQLVATLMTLRREPLSRFEGASISAVLWAGFRPRLGEGAGGGSSSTSP
jgi:hypothetical protein